MTSSLLPDTRHARPGLRTTAIIASALAFVLCTAWLDGGSGIAFASLWSHPDWMSWWNTPLRQFMNALPGLLLAFCLLAWTRRVGWSFVVAFTVQALVYGINAIKVANLAVPLMPADFRLLGQLGHGTGELLSGYLPHPVLLAVGLLAVVAVFATWLRFEPPLLPRRPIRGRAIAGVLLATALVTLVAGMPVWRGVYNPKLLGMQPWSPSDNRQHTGVIGSLLLFHLQYGAQHHKADIPSALALLAAYAPQVDAAAPAGGAGAPKPDIVVVLSESFFDPTILKGYPPGTDFIPNFNRLAGHGVSGRLYVPTFGGGTIRTEFEVLTGLSLRYFPEVQFPYLQIDRKHVPGIVSTLRAHGYTTLAVHGNSPGFWNRTAAFKELGFDKFIAIDDFPASDDANDGKYMSDAAFTDELLRQLPDSGPPRFVLGISIEAHGPYDRDHGIDTGARDAIPVPAGVTDPAARRELQNYIYHMQHADRQLGRLVDELAKRDRRTLVVFFGDHLPAVVPAFEQAGFKNGQGFFGQTPPYVLIDTANMHQAHRQDAAAWELPAMLLSRAGIRDRWFELVGLVAPKLAALTRAPDAPVAQESPQQQRLDRGMRNVAELRLKGKLAALWPEAEAMAGRVPASNDATTTVHAPPAATQANGTPGHTGDTERTTGKQGAQATPTPPPAPPRAF